MKDVALTVRQGTAEKEKRWTTSAYGRDFMWFSVGSVAGTVLLAASPLTTTTPCRTEICRRRLDTFPVRQEGRLIWLSTFFLSKTWCRSITGSTRRRSTMSKWFPKTNGRFRSGRCGCCKARNFCWTISRRFKTVIRNILKRCPYCLLCPRKRLKKRSRRQKRRRWLRKNCQKKSNGRPSY